MKRETLLAVAVVLMACIVLVIIDEIDGLWDAITILSRHVDDEPRSDPSLN